MRLDDAWIALGRDRGEARNRIGDHVFQRRLVVGQPIHEGGIGAVFQQAADQISEQIFMASYRRVDAGACPGSRRAHGIFIELVERFPHAVQTLKFEIAAPAGKGLHGRERVRVVGGELRKDLVGRRQQSARTGKIGRVGAQLAREDGIVGKAELLAALDLAVPIGAFHQAHRNDPLLAAREVDEPVYDR